VEKLLLRLVSILRNMFHTLNAGEAFSRPFQVYFRESNIQNQSYWCLMIANFPVCWTGLTR
jgi:hypothetical protein